MICFESSQRVTAIRVTSDLPRGNKLLNACHLFRQISVVAGSEQSEARIEQT